MRGWVTDEKLRGVFMWWTGLDLCTFQLDAYNHLGLTVVGRSQASFGVLKSLR